MPYIDRNKRPPLDEAIEPLLRKIALGRDKGEMNYVFMRLCLAWLRSRGVSYNSLSDVRALLADVKDEFTEQQMKTYEAKKKAENGEVL